MIVVAEGLALLTVAGALLGPVLLALLAAVTRIAEVRSRDRAHRGEQVDDAAPPVTRLARPAKMIVLLVVGIECFSLVGVAAFAAFRPQGVWYSVLGYGAVGLSVAVVALMTVLWILLIAVAGDVAVRRRVPGRDTWVTYGVLAVLHAFLLLGYLAMAASGTQMRESHHGQWIGRSEPSERGSVTGMAEFDPMKFFALWMFTHDQADDLMVQAVERGRAGAGEGMSGGPDAFTDGFMAMVAEEKARLKDQIASGHADEVASPADERLDEVRFEVAELRGRLDQMQTTLDAIAAHVGVKGA